jgi:cellulose synthase/poly-beta-1,6-N-acetylglucosamine synthase-like glycosyltransferase
VLALHQENGGKASALSHGMEHAHGDVYVYLDADTILAPDAISKLVAHFGNPKVGAVAGNVKVGNRINTLTKLQALEYIASQNLDRRAYAHINAVTVVPGAIGAWRREAVEAAGGYTSDTLAEDMDLTWRVRFAGWKIDNESDAVAYTEAPDTLKSFFKQRFRWTFGTLQCLFKHRRALGRNGLFGRAVLPALWIFQFGIQVIAPFVDLQLLYSVTVFAAAWATHSVMTRDWRPITDAAQTMTYIGFMYALFFLVEFAAAWIAFRMDKEKKSLLWWLFLQRLVYRQVLYFVVWKALWTAFKGVRTGWGKFERRGSVTLATPPGVRKNENVRSPDEPAGKL